MSPVLYQFLTPGAFMFLLKEDIKAELLNYISSSKASDEATIVRKTVF